MNHFKISTEAINHLKKKDKRLAAAIDTIGAYQREINPDLFSALIHSIVGQQISIKAAETVWNRMINTLGKITPQNILAISLEDLQSLGLSFRKTGYIRGVAEMAADGRLNIEALHNMTDDEVCKELVKINGIGIWTAEMLMLFSMQRQNILPYGDLAIHRGMKMLYRHKEITPQLFEKYRKRYSPYGSVASLYLWAIAGGSLDL